MLNAFVRLLLIGLGALIWMILTVFVLRSIGQKQIYADWEHPLKKEFPWQITKSRKVTCEGLRANPSKEFYWIDVAMNAELQWVEKNSGAPIATCLSRPDVRLVFNIVNLPHMPLKELTKLFSETAHESHIVLASPYQRILSEVRKSLPRYLTTASTAEIAKARFLTSIFLEPLATVDADIMILPKPIPRLTYELLRRHKIVLVENKGDYVTPQSKVETGVTK